MLVKKKKKEKIQENSHLSSHLPARFDSHVGYSRSASALKNSREVVWSQCKISFLGEIWETTGLTSFVLLCKLVKAVLKNRTNRKKNKRVKSSLCSMLCLKKKKKFFEDIKRNSDDKSELRFPEVFGRHLHWGIWKKLSYFERYLKYLKEIKIRGRNLHEQITS